MPELPEVETIRRHLAPHVEGRVLEELDVEDPRWCEPLAPGELRDAVEGRVVERIGRGGEGGRGGGGRGGGGGGGGRPSPPGGAPPGVFLFFPLSGYARHAPARPG